MHYYRPDTLDEALATLDSSEVRVAAGCTDLFPATEAPILSGPVLDISGIPELRGISKTEDGWIIGATSTWSDVVSADLPPAFYGLQLAAQEVGAKQIQNRGTVAGNLCNASPAADGVPPLLTLDAEIELRSAWETRRLRLADFLTGPRRTDLRPGELMTAIHVPSDATRGEGQFLKLGARKYLVISIAMCAAMIEMKDGCVSRAALAVGACGPVATRLPEAEAALTGHPLDPALITEATVTSALSPIDDVRADASYRARAAAELLRRTVACLRKREPA